MLRLLVRESHDDWDLLLPRVLFAYRTSFHEALHDSPFFSLYGRDPVLPLDLAFLNTNSDWKSNEVASFRRRLFLFLRDTRRMGRPEKRLDAQKAVTFEEGGPVWVYQYFRALRGERRIKKLAFAWHGPYRKVRTVGENAYRIAIPSYPNKVVTVNVNRFKKFNGRWSRPFPSNVSDGIEMKPKDDDEGHLLEEDLPSPSYVERLSIGGEETAITGGDYHVVDILARRRKDREVQYPVLLATYETLWRSKSTLLSTYGPMIQVFEDARRKEDGLSELCRSARLTVANAAVYEEELFF
ncbi:hypothetical protein F442_09110 [Phytophthora nicotianae P10297]|uniref:Integrase zinc-binding domain-containing protein n=4 Tax=Phytophthora nicotianae TaxID=4792 RepID=V9F4I7_PHYNI|nr:hypothetical protein F443_09177 [Phytophthora nicotianae P1569]ETK86362.1 hypothetical protein L915_09003 [Phytophthora nicotianae]ETP44287.1 hypothetical protein F442_09110 [Phytophthora nicotianae P10297]